MKGKEEQILKMVPDRSKKAQAPEQLKPHNAFPSRDSLLKAFTAKRDANIKYIKETKDPLHAHIAPSPIGEFDAYQWMLFMASALKAPHCADRRSEGGPELSQEVARSSALAK